MIRLRALGAADLRGDDGSELRGVLSQPGQLALLVHLSLARPAGFHRRDLLVGLFWPEATQEQARSALRQAVHRLRRTLGPDVLVSRGAEELALDTRRLWCDVAALEQALQAGDLAGALELYRGDLLPGFFLSDAPRFEEWLEGERVRLRARAAEAAWSLADGEAARGQTSMASHWGRWAAALRPDDEGDLRRLIAMLMRLGDHAGAVHAYEAFSSRLSREYAIAPSRETRALVEPLRRLGPEPPVFGPYTPPAGAIPGAGGPPREAIYAAPDARQHPSIARTIESPHADGPPVAPPPAPPRRRWRRLAAFIPGVGLLLAVAIVAVRQTPAARATAPETVAVLPFAVRGSTSLAYLREGMVDLLGAKLEGVAGLHGIDPLAVLAAVERTGRAQIDPRTADRVARGLGARSFVVGDVVAVAGRVTLSAAMYPVGDRETPAARASVEGEAARLPELVDDLAGKLLARRIPGRDSALTELAARTTRSLPALTAFLEGEQALRAGRASTAREAFLRAVAIDSTFAIAHARLATTRGWSGATSPFDAAAPLAAAQRHASRLSPLGRNLLAGYEAYYSRSDGARAEAIFREITHVHPDRVEAWFMLGESLNHYTPFLDRSSSDARAPFERVLALTPANGYAMVHLARLAAIEGDARRVDSLVRRFLALDPDADRALEMRALAAFTARDTAATRAVLADARHASAFELSVLLPAALHAAENVDAALAVAAVVAARTPATDAPHEALFISLPMASLAAGHLVRGDPAVSAMAAVDAEWALELRAVMAAIVPVALPRDALTAMRDSIAAWRPHADRATSYFAHHAAPMPSLRDYLLAVLSLRLGDGAASDAHLAALDRRAATPGGDDFARAVARDLAHIVRAERLRADGRPRDALAEVQRFRTDLGNPTALRLRAPGAHARVLRAELLLALGRDREAMAIYGSFPEGADAIYRPLAHLRLGEILERLGRRAEAARHYARFREMWRDRDPELRVLVK